MTVTLSMVMVAVVAMVLIGVASYIKGINFSNKNVDNIRVPMVYIGIGTIVTATALLLNYLTPEPLLDSNIEYFYLFQAAIAGAVIWRQKGPTIAWLGGQKKWIKEWSLPNHKYINKYLLKPIHRLDIKFIPIYNRINLTRIGVIGGAYRGFLYLLPASLYMALFIHPIAAPLSLLGLLYGKVHEWVGYNGIWFKKEEGLAARGHVITGTIILGAVLIIPLLIRAL